MMDWESDDRVLTGYVNANIVGMQHQQGRMEGQKVLLGLLREPNNSHDPNAIQVLNTHSLPVGYIDRAVAKSLSPLLDADLVTVEILIPSSKSRPYQRLQPCQLHLFVRLRHLDAFHASVNDLSLNLITPSHSSFTLSDSAAVKETQAQKKSFSIDAAFASLSRSLSSNQAFITLLEPPRSIIKSDLLPHQKEALAWLVHREKPDQLPPFWELSDGRFVNILTHFQNVSSPRPLRGGIFADDMGLGKTLTLLSLIAFDKKTLMGVSKKWRTDRKFLPFENLRKNDCETSLCSGMRTNATLVVCPPSVMSTWITQLEEHAVPGALKTYMYYGERRTKNVEDLKMYDLVLTTYSTLSNERLMPDMPAKKMEWRRIVLDEAHSIKNFNALQTSAVFKLNGQCLWAVTGTPIQSGFIDLFSIMVFLRFEPFSERRYWRELVQRPLNQGKENGLLRLQVLMDAIALRRTKDIALVGLPPKTIEICYVDLSLEERQLYDQTKEETKTWFHGFGYEEVIASHYSAVLSRILRLRQICTDWKLCTHQSQLLKNIEDVSNNPELLQTLLGVLQDGEDFDCPICLSPPTDIVITCCAHIFCRECILRSLQKSNQRCPLCRNELSESDLFSAPPECSKTNSAEMCLSSETELSSKVLTLIKLLIESRKQHPAAKSVVFSQFRKLLLLMEQPLIAAGFKTLRLDGTMNAKHRASVIEKFQVQGRDGPTVLLASLRSSSAGINLTSASRVYFMEPWWNHAVEEQAMDRVHRIGQKEAVKVVRLIAKNSIEEKILILQEKKKQISRGASGVVINGMEMKDIRFLLD